MATLEKSCTFLVATELHPPSPQEIKNALENGDDDARRDALRAALAALVSGGDTVPGLFITVVRYVLPSEDHFTQKLLLLYLVRWIGREEEGKTNARIARGFRLRPPPSHTRASLPPHLLQETIEKTDASGKLLPEMVSSCARGERKEKNSPPPLLLSRPANPPTHYPHTDPHLPKPAQQSAASQRVHSRRDSAPAGSPV